MNVWRLGHRKNPRGFIPRQHCRWHHRFDDPLKKYRTLYCADQAITCLRELLADLRPNLKAIAEFDELFGASPEEALTIAGVVSATWRRQNVLVYAQATWEQGRLVEIENSKTLQHLGTIHRNVLDQHGIHTLNINRIRSQQRIITQKCSRTLYEEGQAGIQFHSRLDQQPCYALFEGRASLILLQLPIPMTENHSDLVQVCGEYTLVLRPV